MEESLAHNGAAPVGFAKGWYLTSWSTMLERGEEGHVINTSSGNGGIAFLPTTPVYESSKAAVTSLTEVLHFQFLMDGSKLQAHVLFPGPHLVNTNILNSDRVRPEAFRIEGRFWILSKLGKSDERLRTRTQSILERENPEPSQ